MKIRSRRLGAALLFGASLAAGSSCALIATVDRDEIPGEAGGGSQGGGDQGGGGQGGGGQGGGDQGGGGAGPGCSDMAKNGAETDVDCGGRSCPPCGTGLACADDADCASGECSGGDKCVDVLLVSEVRSRGGHGDDDEFIELYNPTDVEVIVEETWTIQVRSAVPTDCESTSYAIAWAGQGEAIPAHGHLLIGGTGYDQEPARDASTRAQLPDAASVVLLRGEEVADALCFFFNGSTLDNLTSCSAPYTCEGAPITNPHDNTASTDTDESLERKPGAEQGNATDTDENSNDFAAIAPSRPENSESTATP